LSGGGFEVPAVEDSERGCKLAVTEHPDVILMDLEMPVMDRWEPARTLKKDPRTRNIPIIGMSAYAEASEREKAIATGVMSSMPNLSNLRVYSRPFATCLQSPNRCSVDEANRGNFAALHMSAVGTFRL
jgi:CheY-like chemotaxis protein